MLKDLIDAPSLDALAQIDPADVVHRVAGAIQGYDMPGFVLDDYLASYAGTRYIESVPYVRNYPTGLARAGAAAAGVAHPSPDHRRPG